jgi:hypothetical protein
MKIMSIALAAGLLTGCNGTITAAGFRRIGNPALRRDVKRSILLAGLCAGLSGCILMDQQAATTAKTALVGKSKSEILACAGIPNQTYRDGSTEYLAYAGSGNVRMSATANQTFGTTIYSGASRQSQCVVSIAIQDGTVAAVTYRSTGGAITAPDEACGQIVKGCL